MLLEHHLIMVRRPRDFKSGGTDAGHEKPGVYSSSSHLILKVLRELVLRLNFMRPAMLQRVESHLLLTECIHIYGVLLLLLHATSHQSLTLIQISD